MIHIKKSFIVGGRTCVEVGGQILLFIFLLKEKKQNFLKRKNMYFERFQVIVNFSSHNHTFWTIRNRLIEK